MKLLCREAAAADTKDRPRSEIIVISTRDVRSSFLGEQLVGREERERVADATRVIITEQQRRRRVSFIFRGSRGAEFPNLAEIVEFYFEGRNVTIARIFRGESAVRAVVLRATRARPCAKCGGC